MIIQYDGEDGHGVPLITDIVPRQAEPFVDVRNENVRHHAIGVLEQQYLYSRLSAKPDLPVHETKIEGIQKPSANLAYTYVPPLASMPDWHQAADPHLLAIIRGAKEFIGAGVYDLTELMRRANRATRRSLHRLGARIAGLKMVVTGAALALIGWLAALDRSWLHERYTVSSGVIAWPAKISRIIKLAVPALLILLAVALAVINMPSAINGPKAPVTTAPKHSGAQTSRGSSARAAAFSKSNKNVNSVAKPSPPSMPSGSPLAPTTTSLSGATIIPAATSVTATSPTLPALTSGSILPSAGGLGGGTSGSPSTSTLQTVTSPPQPSTNTAPATSPTTSSLLSPTTVTAPSTSVSAAGQPLISTGSTSVTLP